MEEALTISPVSLFYLGTKMHAKYIDYSYIAGMPDIQKQYEIHEAETFEQLEKDGYVDEDFSGNITIDNHVDEILKPVFFGQIESRVQGKKLFNFHVDIDRVTVAVPITGENKKLQYLSFYKIDNDDIPFFLKQAAGKNGNISINCADVNRGYLNGYYSYDDLKEKNKLEEAVDLVTGRRFKNEN